MPFFSIVHQAGLFIAQYARYAIFSLAPSAACARRYILSWRHTREDLRRNRTFYRSRKQHCPRIGQGYPALSLPRRGRRCVQRWAFRHVRDRQRRYRLWQRYTNFGRRGRTMITGEKLPLCGVNARCGTTSAYEILDTRLLLTCHRRGRGTARERQIMRVPAPLDHRGCR